jgi:2-polyprenyl-3-methyl-5-hydroxy-6-metoxy-1,4-benzoquinol methylase
LKPIGIFLIDDGEMILNAMKGDYYKTKESVDEYIKLAKDVNGGQLINKLKKYLLPNLLLLEIGSGPGTDFQILKKNYRVIGSDYSIEFLNRLIYNNPNDSFLNLDAITLKTDKKFDGIYSNKVLQHLTDKELKESVKSQSKLLNHHGIICHSFWKGEGNEIFNGLFVNYQSDERIRDLFGGDFEVLLIEAYKEFENEDSLLLIAKKK